MKTLLTALILLCNCYVIKAQAIYQHGFYNTNGTFAITSKNGVLFSADGKIISLSNPSSPTLIGNASVTGLGTVIIIDSIYSIIGTSMPRGLVITNISSLNAPTNLSTFQFPTANFTNGIFGLALHDNILYVAAGVDGLALVDISNKSNPVLLNQYKIGYDNCRDVFVNYPLLYIASSTGLKIVDVTIPNALSIISSYGISYLSLDVDLANNWAFAGKNNGGFDMIDITNSQSPNILYSSIYNTTTTWDIKVKDSKVFTSSDQFGLNVFDYSALGITQKANFYSSSNGQSFTVALEDSLILLGGLVQGIHVLQYDPNGVVGINNLDDNPFQVSPNPASDHISFCGDSEHLEVSIYSISGVMVYHCENVNNNSIQLPTLFNGCYFVKSKKNDLIYTSTLIIQHK